MELHDYEFLIATVYNYCMKRKLRLITYSGENKQRPYFFLGSLWRKDLYAVGGNDEEFVAPGYDDDWFGDCLIFGLHLNVRFLDRVVGYHQAHPRANNLASLCAPSASLYQKKKSEGNFIASGGAWYYE